jgi:toxin-antitoxin system PIN domain toxin
MFVVDTNVLVYAADEDSPAHAACKAAVEGWRAQPSAWFTTWSILYEFLRVVSHPRVLRSPWKGIEAWRFVEALLASPALEVLSETDRHAELAAKVLAELPWLAGNLFHDAHIAVLMREHGVHRIYTRDADFHRFPFLEVVDPLSERRPG